LIGKKVEWQTSRSVFDDFGISKEYSSDQVDFTNCLNILDSIYHKKNRPLIIANFTDLPFEGYVPSQRVKGLPLWPDNDVLLFKREQEKYLELLDNVKFDIIFITILDFSGYYFTNYVFTERALQNYTEIYRFGLKKYEGERSISIMIPK
jgi:hypothetical protein